MEQKRCYLLELGEDGEDEGENAKQCGGEAELRALAQSHGTDRRPIDPLQPRRTMVLDLSAPASIGVPGDSTGSRSRC
jgi:hypothetical protein